MPKTTAFILYLGEFDKNLSNSLIQDIVGSETGLAEEGCVRRSSDEEVTSFAIGPHKLSQSNKLRITSIHGAVS
ncbi:hypothetical protein AB7Y51_29285 [Escherichia coli]